MTKINNLQYTYSYRGLASAAHSTYHYAIGNSINLSQVSSTSTDGYVISGDYYRTASGVPTTVNGASGNFTAYYVGGDGSENVRKRTGQDSFDSHIDDISNGLTGAGYVFDAASNRIGNVLKHQALYHGSYPTTILKTPITNIHVLASMLRTTGTAFKQAGRAADIGSVLLARYQYGTGQIIGTEASVYAAFGIIGFMGPVGASILYFVGKFIYEKSTEKTLFDKPEIRQ